MPVVLHRGDWLNIHLGLMKQSRFEVFFQQQKFPYLPAAFCFWHGKLKAGYVLSLQESTSTVTMDGKNFILSAGDSLLVRAQSTWVNSGPMCNSKFIVYGPHHAEYQLVQKHCAYECWICNSLLRTEVSSGQSKDRHFILVHLMIKAGESKKDKNYQNKQHAEDHA